MTQRLDRVPSGPGGPGQATPLVRSTAVLGGLVCAGGVLAALHAAPSVLVRGRVGERLLPTTMGVGAPSGVALTFDDGPDPLGTPAVLDALAGAGAVATFFVVGRQVQAHPGLVDQIIAGGHEVALHGHEHRSHIGRSPTSLVRDLQLARSAVAFDAGEDVAASIRYTRPPFGVVSGGSLWAARRNALRTVLWTAWGRDWEGREPDAVVATAFERLSAGGTLLLHDSDAYAQPDSWKATAAAVPAVVERLRQRGLEMRRLSDHLGA